MLNIKLHLHKHSCLVDTKTKNKIFSSVNRVSSSIFPIKDANECCASYVELLRPYRYFNSRRFQCTVNCIFCAILLSTWCAVLWSILETLGQLSNYSSLQISNTRQTDLAGWFFFIGLVSSCACFCIFCRAKCTFIWLSWQQHREINPPPPKYWLIQKMKIVKREKRKMLREKEKRRR